MKKTLAVTSLVAGVCTIVSLKNTVHAQDRLENKAAAHSVRNGKRGQRSSSNSSPVPFNDATDSSIVSKVQRGLDAAPVPLNLSGKDIGLVGLGSYLVNIQMGCNGCHSAGPATEWAAGGNPYFGQPKVTNPVTYLGGGRDFGALIPGSASIVSRNLTPDKSGLPVGGQTFDEFVQIIRTGVDIDNLHPNCSAAPNANCIPRPFEGTLLQIMPWPSVQGMSDNELGSIYEYLSAVPCVAGPPAPSPLHNDCS